MKRALTLALTVALIGSLTFIGFAGTAAADTHIENDADLDEQEAEATTEQDQENDQDASNDAEVDQEQEQTQQNKLYQGGNIAATLDGNADAGNDADQTNVGFQGMDADLDLENAQESEQDQDADTEAESEFRQELDIENLLSIL
ncbi:toxin transporter [Natronorubrum aibiense]|uniref:Toxin transporter n=1 Tax=Natronorubrum aibiense TaxID=348826 RepID=A0A5P9P817_9EURY|nr:toxin transporter [Natronorubrum aibiense]QFU84311.1 toxin transporter [Natronorubrum aibiense]